MMKPPTTVPEWIEAADEKIQSADAKLTYLHWQELVDMTQTAVKGATKEENTAEEDLLLVLAHIGLLTLGKIRATQGRMRMCAISPDN